MKIGPAAVLGGTQGAVETQYIISGLVSRALRMDPAFLLGLAACLYSVIAPLDPDAKPAGRPRKPRSANSATIIATRLCVVSDRDFSQDLDQELTFVKTYTGEQLRPAGRQLPHLIGAAISHGKK